MTYSAAPESWMIPAQHRIASIQWSYHTTNLVEAGITLTAYHLTNANAWGVAQYGLQTLIAVLSTQPDYINCLNNFKKRSESHLFKISLAQHDSSEVKCTRGSVLIPDWLSYDHRQKNIQLSRYIFGRFHQRSNTSSHKMASVSGQQAAMTLELSWTNHRSFKNNHYFSSLLYLNRKCHRFLQRTVIQYGKPVPKIPSVVTIDGAYESMLVAIKQPSVFCDRVSEWAEV